MNILEARRRMLGAGVYKKTVTGNPAIAQNSLARMYPGIEMQGWTEQKSTTGAQLFDASGKEVNSSTFIPFPVAVTDGKYTLSTNANKSSSGNSFVFFSGGNVTSGGYGVYEGKSVTVDSVDGYVTILMRKMEGIDPIKNFEIMLNAGTTAKPYEPYTGGAPSPSPDYPQEIVSAGNWNKETRKWEYEITITNTQTDPDKNQTVLLTSDRPLTKLDKLEKRNGQWGWVYKSSIITIELIKMINLSNGNKGGVLSVSNKFLFFNTENFAENAIKNNTYKDGTYYENKENFVFCGTSSDTLETLKQKYDGADFVYQTVEETFIPLTETEQEQMNALHTNRPTTVLSNDADCEMTLTYKTRKSMEVTT